MFSIGLDMLTGDEVNDVWLLQSRCDPDWRVMILIDVLVYSENLCTYGTPYFSSSRFISVKFGGHSHLLALQLF